MKLKLLFIISNRAEEEKILEAVSSYGSVFTESVLCYGTAKSSILAVLGLGETERSLIIMSLTEDKLASVYEILRRSFHFDEAGKGIAFTVPVSAVGGPATLKIMTGDLGLERR